MVAKAIVEGRARMHFREHRVTAVNLSVAEHECLMTALTLQRPQALALDEPRDHYRVILGDEHADSLPFRRQMSMRLIARHALAN